MNRNVRLLTVAASAAAAVGLSLSTLSTAGAVTAGGFQVTSGSFGVMYGPTDQTSLSAIRAWENATWCRVQPSEGSDIAANLESMLGTQLDQQIASGATTAIVGLGHPAPWVFANSAAAGRSAVEYSCGNNAAGVSIPSSASLRPNADGSASVQATRWANYVSAVVAFLNARYGQRLNVLLQVYNEPNLTSGLDVRRKVPGAAQTIKDAASSLYTYEKIASGIVASIGNPAIKLTSTSMFQKPNAFFLRYMSLQNKRPVVSSLAFNIYSAKGKTPEAMVTEWNKRVLIVKSKVNKYKHLRRLPALITETNLNLVNNTYDTSNLRSAVSNPDQQRRLATAIQMDAFYHGYSAVYWLTPSPSQAAVQIGYGPGSVARNALGVLRATLVGRVMTRCQSKSKVRTCYFRDPSGARRDVRVIWRNHGTSRVAAPAGTLTQMNGSSSQFGGGRLTVGTTPVVLG
ncbi:MAG: hypothetical protein ACOYEV_13400 [Candidatus Nanopelagicales bacterium]